MIKVISFDLDGTIMQPGFGNSVWLDGLPKVLASQKGISNKSAKEKMIKSYNKIGTDNRKWYDLSYWINKLDLELEPYDLLYRYKDIIKPYSDAYEVIDNLSKKYELIISSGAMKEFINFELSNSGLIHYFKEFFSSTSDTNTVKKDPYFYKMICQEINVNPNQIIHIGDSYEYDFVSPKKAGLNAYFLKRDAISNDCYTVKSLKQFEKIIDEIYHLSIK